MSESCESCREYEDLKNKYYEESYKTDNIDPNKSINLGSSRDIEKSLSRIMDISNLFKLENPELAEKYGNCICHVPDPNEDEAPRTIEPYPHYKRLSQEERNEYSIWMDKVRGRTGWFDLEDKDYDLLDKVYKINLSEEFLPSELNYFVSFYHGFSWIDKINFEIFDYREQVFEFFEKDYIIYENRWNKNYAFTFGKAKRLKTRISILTEISKKNIFKIKIKKLEPKREQEWQEYAKLVNKILGYEEDEVD